MAVCPDSPIPAWASIQTEQAARHRFLAETNYRGDSYSVTVREVKDKRLHWSI
jgi:hypothetical protein